MPDPDATLSLVLSDAADGSPGTARVRLAASPGGVAVHADGYGDRGTAPGHGSPVFLELYRGELRLLVWADITADGPTHVIPLGGAREGRRPADDAA